MVKASQPWAWVKAPVFPPCSNRTPKEFWCLSVEDGRTFLHWQEEQQRNFEGAMLDLDRRADLEEERRKVLTAKPATNWELVIGLAIGIPAAVAAGFGLGYGIRAFTTSPR